jgi:hypothetical protein
MWQDNVSGAFLAPPQWQQNESHIGSESQNMAWNGHVVRIPDETWVCRIHVVITTRESHVKGWKVDSIVTFFTAPTIRNVLWTQATAVRSRRLKTRAFSCLPILSTLRKLWLKKKFHFFLNNIYFSRRKIWISFPTRKIAASFPCKHARNRHCFCRSHDIHFLIAFYLEPKTSITTLFYRDQF